MDQTLHSIGRPGGLQFDLRWLDEPNEGKSATYGSLIAWADGKLVWGQTDENGHVVGIEWFWSDLLERLAFSWRFLLLEEAYPLGLLPPAPQLLRAVLRERRIGASEEMVNAEDNSVFAFEEMHDLSRAIEGATVPKLFLMREGSFMLVATSLGVDRVGFRAAMEALEQLGEKIAAKCLGRADAQLRSIVEAWQTRQDISEIEKVEIASGLPGSTLMEITGNSEFKKFWEVANDQFDPNELMAAARMVGRLVSNDDTRRILSSIKNVGRIDTPTLDQLSSEATPILDRHGSKMPHEQGRLLAEWLRSKPGVVSKSGLVHPEKVLKGWGVPLREIELHSQNIDALCAWGPSHGPVVVLNKAGHLSHYPTGRRSSVAHEICHLLVDRKGALPVTEVFGGEVPKVPEQRANGFGAELLLPRAFALRSFEMIGDVEETLRQIAERYNVSFEVAAWQLLNSNPELSTGQRHLLLKHTYRFRYSAAT